MKWAAWIFSAKLAWQNPLMRWASIGVAVLFAGVVPYFLLRVIPQAARHGTVALHYNLYFGIDNVQAWGWAFALPGAWLILIAADACVSFGCYREDAPLAIGLITVLLFWSLAWARALLSLIYMNI